MCTSYPSVSTRLHPKSHARKVTGDLTGFWTHQCRRAGPAGSMLRGVCWNFFFFSKSCMPRFCKQSFHKLCANIQTPPTWKPGLKPELSKLKLVLHRFRTQNQTQNRSQNGLKTALKPLLWSPLLFPHENWNNFSVRKSFYFNCDIWHCNKLLIKSERPHPKQSCHHQKCIRCVWIWTYCKLLVSSTFQLFDILMHSCILKSMARASRHWHTCTSTSSSSSSTFSTP